MLTEELQVDGGRDSLTDRFRCGYIAAVKDLLLIELDDTKETL